MLGWAFVSCHLLEYFALPESFWLDEIGLGVAKRRCDQTLPSPLCSSRESGAPLPPWLFLVGTMENLGPGTGPRAQKLKLSSAAWILKSSSIMQTDRRVCLWSSSDVAPRPPRSGGPDDPPPPVPKQGGRHLWSYLGETNDREKIRSKTQTSTSGRMRKEKKEKRNEGIRLPRVFL